VNGFDKHNRHPNRGPLRWAGPGGTRILTPDNRAPRSPCSPMTTYPIIEVLGDGISSELSTSVHQIADTLPF